MKDLRYILAGTALTVLSLNAGAQTQVKDTTVTRTVVVEQEYNPDITDASKINVLPKVNPLVVSKKKVEYDVALVPAGEIPTGIMQVFAGKEVQTKALPGYARLGHGNYDNLDVAANYLFSLSDRDRLDLAFRTDGMNGKLDLPNGKWKSRYYRTNASMDYTHAFDKVDLDIAGRFGLGNFNLLPRSVASKQKFTSGDVHFGVKSTDDRKFRFRAGVDLLFYERQHDYSFNGTRETIVRTEAEVTGNIFGNRFVGIAFAMDNTFYNGNTFKNFHALNLNPYYLIQDDEWKVRLGAHVDPTMGFGKKLRVAPDVTAEYTFSDSYTLYAQAKGGKRQNDFRRLESIHPYGQLTTQVDATYEQLNAALGFKASPAPGVWFNLYGGYQNLKDDLMFFPRFIGPVNLIDAAQANTDNLYAGAEAAYSYKDLVVLSASGVYRSWKASGEESVKKRMLAFKPALEVNFRMDIRPVPSVLFGLGYLHVLREKAGTAAKPIGNLYAGGSYELFKGISVYVRADNLLNKGYQYVEACPVEGINFVGGVSFQF